MGTFSPAAFRSLFTRHRIYWQCFFGAYCVGLDQILPIELVSSLDHGSDLELIRGQCGIHFCAVEEPNDADGHTRWRRNWIGASIETAFQRRRAAIERQLRAHPRQSWWITSSPASDHLAMYCRENGYRYVGPSPDLTASFQQKQRLVEALRELRLPCAQGEWLSLRGTTYQELHGRWGRRFVLQKAVGAAGSGTRLVQSEADFQRAVPCFGDAMVLVSPYIGGVSLNINAAVIGGEAFVGPPNVQLSGIEALGSTWGGYCGNDYSAADQLDQDLVAGVQEQAARIGRWMAGRGFDGLYGLDFVLSERDGRAYAVDLNPRWQGSTTLSIQAELASGRLPLAAAEFAYRCGVISLAEVRVHADAFGRPLAGAQMCLRSSAEQALRVGGNLHPGLYQSPGKPRFVRSAFRLADCATDDQWLITGGVPETGTWVAPGSWLVRIYTNRTVVGPESSALSDWASRVAAHAFAASQLTAVSPLAE